MVAITAQNGALPASALVTVDQAGHRLHVDAAAALDRLSVAMISAGHGRPTLSAGHSAYRTLDEQRYMISIGLTTMPAGQSQHGEGVAADFAQLGGFAGARYRWLAAHGREYGWVQPKWATAKGSLPESWHWEYRPDLDHHRSSPPTQEDDMPTIDEIGERMKEILRAPEFQGYFQQPTSVVVGGATMGPAPTSRFAADTRADVMRILDIVRGISAQITALGTAAPAQDVDAIAAAIADSLDDSLAARVADLLSKRLAA